MKKCKSIRIIQSSEMLSTIDLNYLKGGASEIGCTKCKGTTASCNVNTPRGASTISAF